MRLNAHRTDAHAPNAVEADTTEPRWGGRYVQVLSALHAFLVRGAAITLFRLVVLVRSVLHALVRFSAYRQRSLPPRLRPHGQAMLSGTLSWGEPLSRRNARLSLSSGVHHQRTHPVKATGRSLLERAGSSSFRADVLQAPLPWQELVDPLGGMIGQVGEHVGEPGLRVDIVELGGRD
jgi:hypothetical protein